MRAYDGNARDLDDHVARRVGGEGEDVGVVLRRVERIAPAQRAADADRRAVEADELGVLERVVAEERRPERDRLTPGARGVVSVFWMTNWAGLVTFGNVPRMTSRSSYSRGSFRTARDGLLMSPSTVMSEVRASADEHFAHHAPDHQLRLVIVNATLLPVTAVAAHRRVP